MFAKVRSFLSTSLGLYLRTHQPQCHRATKQKSTAFDLSKTQSSSWYRTALAGTSLALASLVPLGLDSSKPPNGNDSETPEPNARTPVEIIRVLLTDSDLRQRKLWFHSPLAQFYRHRLKVPVSANPGFQFLDTVNVHHIWASRYAQTVVSSLALVPSHSLVPTCWTYILVSEGFNGGEVLYWLHHNFIQIVHNYLMECCLREYAFQRSVWESEASSSGIEASPESYQESLDSYLKAAFVDTDNQFVQFAKRIVMEAKPEGRQEAARLYLDVALSGACAVLTFYDSASRMLTVAHVGDSRAILGRRQQSRDGRITYEPVVLTRDHVPNVTRHPAADPKLLQLQEDIGKIEGRPDRPVLKAFGMAGLKWGREIQERAHQLFLAERPNNLADIIDANGEPVIDALPDISHIKVQCGDFLIIATGEAWRTLTNIEAIALVGLWLLGQPDGNMSSVSSSALTQHISDEAPTGHLNEMGADATEAEASLQTSSAILKATLDSDVNVAAHLSSNIYGGTDPYVATSRLSPIRRSRHG
ncbi:hypothetical protein FA15DRAFT_704387 [Coprinopsis marcescibilis]|uniref:PPM-type phosphatase domain-containing protein n=1 Tax=Coprinopsis marcescibilis TaxID=230819 RepID=A0A5C3KW09_COPMA|nr:hypothetical protein FA15DRAFT_704387 [Coprinopsis marcescibilis]